MRSKRTHKKIDQRKTIVPNMNVVARANTVLGDMIEDDDKEEELKHKAGRKSYVFKAKDQGLYDLITFNIEKFRIDHPDSTFKELFEYIQPLFPTIFPVDMNTGNFGTHIQQDKGWCEAYFSASLKTLDLAEIRIREKLRDENTDAKTIVNAYDKINRYELERLKLKLDSDKEQYELEMLKMKTKLMETQIERLKSGQVEDPYINSFLRDLSQLGGE